MNVPAGGIAGCCVELAAADGGTTNGDADGVTGCAVGTLGDGSAGSVVTETIGVGAGVFAARDDTPALATIHAIESIATHATNQDLFILYPPV
ncbi:MAG: hypothetical protein JO293_07460 [Candidatus Eremiobacteraeota bacterium]|nr:hypothetical protein [Candidatus Eremiobacteraeota bacterium]MBV8223185.1 hypothetical protein [Candidatus Eremiobacteraeota bacterium]MBV8280472.1 hypothetical protein [Candidatus Eremiobacteraeota bacterium]